MSSDVSLICLMCSAFRLKQWALERTDQAVSILKSGVLMLLVEHIILMLSFLSLVFPPGVFMSPGESLTSGRAIER